MMKISKEELARRLEKTVGVEDGKKGLETLLFGWKEKRKFGKKYRKALLNRDWMYITEVMDLSEYAGYDLTQ